MRRPLTYSAQPWSGLILGLLGWYGAHELGFNLLAPNCDGQRWLIPLIHGVALLLALFGALLSWSTPRLRDYPFFAAMVGTGAGLLFAFVILWQGVATFFFTGCER